MTPTITNEQTSKLLEHTYINSHDIMSEYGGADKEGFLRVYGTLLLHAIQMSYFDVATAAQDEAPFLNSIADLLAAEVLSPSSSFTQQDYARLENGDTGNNWDKYEWDIDRLVEAATNQVPGIRLHLNVVTMEVGNETIYYTAEQVRNQELLEDVFHKAKICHLNDTLESSLVSYDHKPRLAKI